MERSAERSAARDHAAAVVRKNTLLMPKEKPLVAPSSGFGCKKNAKRYCCGNLRTRESLHFTFISKCFTMGCMSKKVKEKTQVNFRLPSGLFKDLQDVADRSGLTQTGIVTEGVRQRVQELKKILAKEGVER